jgi:hypothetical protein
VSLILNALCTKRGKRVIQRQKMTKIRGFTRKVRVVVGVVGIKEYSLIKGVWGRRTGASTVTGFDVVGF